MARPLMRPAISVNARTGAVTLRGRSLSSFCFAICEACTSALQGVTAQGATPADQSALRAAYEINAAAMGPSLCLSRAPPGP